MSKYIALLTMVCAVATGCAYNHYYKINPETGEKTKLTNIVTGYRMDGEVLRTTDTLRIKGRMDVDPEVERKIQQAESLLQEVKGAAR